MSGSVILVDVSELAYAVGFRVLRGETHHFRNGLPDGREEEPVSIYLTRLLWADLGGEGEDQEAYRARAQQLLAAAHQSALAHTINGTAWRAGVTVFLDGRRLQLWLILGHSYSDGYMIGYGPGDIWGAPGSSLRPTQI